MNKHFIRSMRQKGTIIIFSISTIESLKFNRTSATSFAIDASFPCLSIDIIRYQRIIIYGSLTLLQQQREYLWFTRGKDDTAHT